MKPKISLLKDCFSKETFSGKAEKDEMIIFESNKICSVGLSSLALLILIFGFFGTHAVGLDLRSVEIVVIGVVYYGILIAFCKKGIVKHLMALIAFAWGIILLPFSIIELIWDRFIAREIYVAVLYIVIAILLYVISDIIYKKAYKKAWKEE